MAMCHMLLLGGIGSGKSTVARLLSDSGWEVVQSDRIGHQVLEEDEVLRQISALWPSVIVGGQVDRRRLSAIVFADKSQLLRLEAITHPRIRQRLAARVAAARGRFLAVEMPLLGELAEGNWLRVVVDAPIETRMDRLVSRGMSVTDAQTRMDLQPTRCEYLAVADYVIDNRGSEGALGKAVEHLVKTVEACAAGESSAGPTSDAHHRMLPE